MIAYACGPSYLGDGGRRISLRPNPRKNKRHYLKNKQQEKGLGVRIQR
jgi:hypothetical protein